MIHKLHRTFRLQKTESASSGHLPIKSWFKPGLNMVKCALATFTFTWRLKSRAIIAQYWMGESGFHATCQLLLNSGRGLCGWSQPGRGYRLCRHIFRERHELHKFAFLLLFPDVGGQLSKAN